MKKTLRTNCPRDCYDGCGILVELRDDQKPRILGDPDHPVSRGRLCSKCAIAYNGVWQDSKARLTQPLRRVGAKGEAKFETISWDDALVEVAQQFQEIIEHDGADSILHTHYSGTLSLIAYLFPNRFFQRLGASEVDPDTICNAAGHVAWHLQFGNSMMGFDPRTAKDARCITLWGTNPSHSAPHAHEYWLPESPAKILVVDPLKTETAAAADLHLQLRPGSDAALAFGLLNALREAGKFDQAFIDAYTTGADQIGSSIDKASLAWTAEQTGLDSALILEAASMYGSGPSMLWCGQALQRQTHGGNIMRAVGLLPVMTGNVGKPGTGFYYLNLTPGFAGIDFDYLVGSELNEKPGKTVSHMDLASRLSDCNEFKALVAWNTNPLASAPNQKKLREACAREDLFTVVVDCFPTDTCAYADIVLPAASFLEFDDITFSYFHLHMGAQTKISEPLGESFPNQEIFRRLSRAMGYNDAPLFETDEDIIKQLMEQMDPGFDFEELKKRGHFYLSDEPMVPYADYKFDTPSGKIEIASEAAAELGLPLVPQANSDCANLPGHWRLLSPASKWRLNDSYANDSHIAEQAGAATVWLNSTDASDAGIVDGSTVRVSNATGSIDMVANVSDEILAGTALSYKGRWPSLESDSANINVVHTPIKADMGESTSVHTTQVRIEAL